ncbi:hypothetical protein DPMN_165384 [Dreissena polymorpha]|uniref:Uncharacterized protein n=1 Tax=Dreissena polymorpha TaxID=45954 RepID=A0A9D4IWY5_DREPO|nr:hypothetical protein DPMN_165384 [Dreissena polymorpha]
MWTILSVIVHVLSKDPTDSTSPGALWALQVAWRTRSPDLPVCVTVQDTIIQQCTNQNRKIKPAPIMSNNQSTDSTGVTMLLKRIDIKASI